jgi:hypothetical protein
MLSRYDNKNLFLSLTPSAAYALELLNYDFITYHDIITQKELACEILFFFDEMIHCGDSTLDKGMFFSTYKIVNYLTYLEHLLSYIFSSEKSIVLITDKYKSDTFTLNNNISQLANFLDKYQLKSVSRALHDDRKSIHGRIRLKEIINKFKNFFSTNGLRYDWAEIRPKGLVKHKIKPHDNGFNIESLIRGRFQYIRDISINKALEQNSFLKKTIVSNYITFLDGDKFRGVLSLKEKGEKIYSFQHGNYLYNNLFLRYNEIFPSDVNFVFNDYTKSLFKSLGSQEVHSVGSILFNKPIIEKFKKFDFLYITQGQDYTGSFQYVDCENSLHSFDGYALYKRHKSVIDLFGKHYSDKNIVIKVHPTVVTNGVYVPFWELSEKYENITIDVSTPVHDLIEVSKYLISDYFTTEFINRELHYKRNIILFKGGGMPIPKDTLNDMEKIFITIDTVDELRVKVKMMKRSVEDKYQYNDIIEYYSSKKIDTKVEVSKILKKHS